MKILVTGGAGFIGSHVVDAYVNQGHNVWVIDNESSGVRNQVHSKARYQKLDIRNKKKLNQFFQNKKFDLVNHHAAQIDVRLSVSDPQFDAEVNIFGLLSLLKLAHKTKVKKFIFSASGGTAYGDCRKPASESVLPVPLAPYGISKLAGEKYIQSYGALYGMKYTVFRYANVYGPRQDPHGEAGVVAIFSNLFIDEKTPKIFGNGKQTRDFVYVKDVAKANALALKKGHNEVLNIGTGKETSVNGLYNQMASISGFEKKAIYRPARPGELQRSVLNSGLAKRKLNWTASTNLKSGLKETYDYFVEKRKRKDYR